MPEEWNPRLFPGLHTNVHAHLHIYTHTCTRCEHAQISMQAPLPPAHTYLQKMGHGRSSLKSEAKLSLLAWPKWGWDGRSGGSKALKGHPSLPSNGSVSQLSGKAHLTGLALVPGPHDVNHDRYLHFYDCDITSQILSSGVSRIIQIILLSWSDYLKYTKDSKTLLIVQNSSYVTLLPTMISSWQLYSKFQCKHVC